MAQAETESQFQTQILSFTAEEPLLTSSETYFEPSNREEAHKLASHLQNCPQNSCFQIRGRDNPEEDWDSGFCTLFFQLHFYEAGNCQTLSSEVSSKVFFKLQTSTKHLEQD